jgi:hypothetical protein
LKRGWLRLYLLWLDGKPAACLYGFFYSRKFYFYQSASMACFENHSPGMLTMGLAIQQAIQEGAEEYDLLHGTESYKKHGAGTHPRVDPAPTVSSGRVRVAVPSFDRTGAGFAITLARRMPARRQGGMIRSWIKTGAAGIVSRCLPARVRFPLWVGYHRVVEDFASSAQGSIPSMLISARMLGTASRLDRPPLPSASSRWMNWARVSKRAAAASTDWQP